MRPKMHWLIVSVAAFAIVSCVPKEKTGGVKPSPLTDVERAACIANGGKPQWFGLFMSEGCIMPPEDMGKMCKASTDCTVQCLAKTRTCGPLNSGEYDILDENGQVTTVMIE